jgi:hypothetical protein
MHREVSEQGHHLGAPAGPGDGKRHAVGLVLVEIGLGRGPHERGVLEIAEPEGDVDPSCTEQSVAAERLHPRPELTSDEVRAGGGAGDLCQPRGALGARVAQLGRGPEGTDLQVGAQVRSHLELAPVDDLPVDRVPDVALANPAAGPQPRGLGNESEDPSGHRLAVPLVVGIVPASVARAEEQLALRPAVLVEERSAGGVGVTRRALRVSVPDHEGVGVSSTRHPDTRQEQPASVLHGPWTENSTCTATAGSTWTPR